MAVVEIKTKFRLITFNTSWILHEFRLTWSWENLEPNVFYGERWCMLWSSMKKSERSAGWDSSLCLRTRLRKSGSSCYVAQYVNPFRKGEDNGQRSIWQLYSSGAHFRIFVCCLLVENFITNKWLIPPVVVGIQIRDRAYQWSMWPRRPSNAFLEVWQLFETPKRVGVVVFLVINHVS